MVSESYIDSLSSGRTTAMNLSFAGCGFLGIYHVGVASCIREYAPHLAADKIAGASAGAIAAVGLVCDCDLGMATTQVLQVALKARSYTLGPLHPTFSIVDFVKGLLDDFLPYNAHVLASGRIHISLTRMSDRKNVIVNQFDSREDLIQALICSAYIPFYCGLMPPKYKGTYYLDGGLSDNIPILDDQTITVSPFAGESDICPSDETTGTNMHVHLANTSIQVSSANLYRFGCIVFPPSPETLSKMCQQGFDDCLTFLQKYNLISCARHLSIFSSITAAEITPPQQTQSTSTSTNQITTRDHVDSWLRIEELDKELSATESSSEYDVASLTSSDDTSSQHGEFCDDDDVMHFCEECAHRRTLAVPESLPTPVRIALQAACDSVNSGLFGYLNRVSAFRVVSLMAAPAYLPLEVTYSLARRFAEWVPYMPDDMQWFVREFACILRDTYEYVQASRHRYSARFTCQLAITELDQGRGSSGETSPVSTSRVIPKISVASEPHTLPPNAKRHVNVGFSLWDIESKGADPLECVDNVRHHLLSCDDDVVVHQLPPTDCVELDSEAIPEPVVFGHVDETGSGSTPHARSRSASFSAAGVSGTTASSKHHHHHHHHHHGNHNTCRHGNKVDKQHQHQHHAAQARQQHEHDATFDTFENCLHIADQMDSILSYYYAEEDNPNVIRVAEIYPLNDAAGPEPKQPVLDLASARDRLHAIKDRAGRPRSDSNRF